jgi:SAM-dependent methyltransferase
VKKLSHHNSLERALLAKLSLSPTTFNVNIHEEDEMYLWGLQHVKSVELARQLYFWQGAQILDTVRQVAKWKFQSLSNVPCFLDFACGYGRLTRYVVQEITPDRVWASDIYAKAVEFQRQQFGVNGFVSVTDPATLVVDQRFDMIFVASLFTHLPERRFEQWFKTLYDLLTPNGILVFSVHDEGHMGQKPMPPSGFLFTPFSESKYLELAEYGSTFVTEAFLRGLVGRTVRANWPYHRVQRALCGAHDVYLVSKNPQEDYASLRYEFGLVGYVDSFKLTETNELRVDGWVGDPNDGKDIREVQVFINDTLVKRCSVKGPRPDVVNALGVSKYATSGWEIVYPLEDVASQLESVAEIRAVSTDGTSRLLHMAAIKTGRCQAAA